jgi:hypothetical protein
MGLPPAAVAQMHKLAERAAMLSQRLQKVLELACEASDALSSQWRLPTTALARTPRHAAMNLSVSLLRDKQ